MKNKVGWNLTETWLGKSLVRMGQNVDEVWMDIGQYLVRSWSAFKANKVGQNLDESWTDFHPFRVCQGYAKGMPEFLSNKLLQPYSSITPKIARRLLQLFSNTSPKIGCQRLHQSYTNPTLKFKQFSLKRLSQQLPNDYPENRVFSLNASGQYQDEIGIENCVKVASKFRQFEDFKVGQLLGETWVVLGPFYLEWNLVIQPLSFIAHSFIVHNKRVQDKRLDVPKLFLYVVLPNQNL